MPAMEIQYQHAQGSATGIDVQQMTDAIWEEMHGQVEKGVIRQALEEILPAYRQARVQLFVPILMRRDVTELLHRQSLDGAGI